MVSRLAGVTRFASSFSYGARPVEVTHARRGILERLPYHTSVCQPCEEERRSGLNGCDVRPGGAAKTLLRKKVIGKKVKSAEQWPIPQKLLNNLVEKESVMASRPGTTPVGPQTLFNMPAVRWSWLMTLGVVMLVLGSLAIIFPVASSVSIDLLLGIVLTVGGVGRVISIFRSKGWGDFFLKLVVSAIYLVAGIMLLAYPLEGTLTITLLLAIFFLAQGVVNIVVSFIESGMRGWGWMLFNGIVSLILGALIWAELPSSAAWAIGLLVGIWLIFDGWAMISLSWLMHQDEERAAT